MREDDWSIPSYRCFRAPSVGVAVYDGADRCALLFAIPIEEGRKLSRVRALYEDDDLVSQFSMQVLSRHLATAVDSTIVSGIDFSAGPAELESMTLVPELMLTTLSSAYVLVEVQGDTRLLGLTYEFK